MNEELQNQLSVILQGVINTADSTSAFLIEEIPDVIQQLLMWKMCESLISCLLLPTILVIIFFYKERYTKVCSKLMNHEERYIPEAVISPMFLGMFTLGGLCELNITWLQIWVAPKIYLMEYASSLVK